MSALERYQARLLARIGDAITARDARASEDALRRAHAEIRFILSIWGSR